MLEQEHTTEMEYSMLTIIVNRGKGSKIMQFARARGAQEASCFLGKGTVNNAVLQMIEMNEVKKEIVLIVVPSIKEKEILEQLCMKFHFQRQNHGIAFTLPLAGIFKLKKEDSFKWENESLSEGNTGKYTCVFLIVDKGKAESVVEISQKAGYYGGTIIKAHGSANKLNIALNMLVEPEKEAVLMLTESERANQLADLLKNQLKLNRENTGILVMAQISEVIGLFQTSSETEGRCQDE